MSAPIVPADREDGPAGRLIYLHGFRSSPRSFKARLLAGRMAALGLADRFACPQLPASPAESIALVEGTLRPGPADLLVGSSLGGLHAIVLAARHGCRAALLNPAVAPADRLAAHVGRQEPWHGGEPFEFTPAHVDELRALAPPALARPERCLLIAATGDELLDWREMVAFCRGARQVVIQGGDHGLSDFAEHVDTVLRFGGFLAGHRSG